MVNHPAAGRRTAPVYRQVEELPERILDSAREMPLPNGVLLCPPDYFRVIDVKNPFMEGQYGKVDPTEARRQWDQLKAVLESLPLEVQAVAPLPDCEDMVFAANQTFVGLDEEGTRICVPSRMKHPSRRREVPVFVEWFRSRHYTIAELTGSGFFEGGGDALWHPGRGLIWAGHGPRSDSDVLPQLAGLFSVPVMQLDLVTDRFYHLDTCFCAIDPETVAVFPPAFSEQSLALIRSIFPVVIEADEREATELMACNAAAFLNRYVVIQAGCTRLTQRLTRGGFEVIEVETGEFMKSGGSVFCMKMSFWT